MNIVMKLCQIALLFGLVLIADKLCAQEQPTFEQLIAELETQNQEIIQEETVQECEMPSCEEALTLKQQEVQEVIQHDELTQKSE